jgi:SnoaL-like domain
MVAESRQAMTEHSAVTRLLDLEDIRRLVLRYSVAIERRDADLMASLFSPNARFGRWGEGEAGMRALMRETLESSILAVILVANHLIDFDGPDEAHGQVWARCYVQNDPGEFVEQLIKYEDTYERIEGRWTFLRRGHRLWFGAAVADSPLDQPPANWPEHQVGVGDVPLADPAFTAWYRRERR